MKFFTKRAQQLLNSMFQVDDIHVIGAFLHPNYKTLRFTTSTQIDYCHQACRNATVPDGVDNEQDEETPDGKPKEKRQNLFMESLMDYNMEVKRKKVNSAAVEREFSAAGQIVSQRRSTIDPSTVNNILFLRSIENNRMKMPIV
ncbi:unnamed protein product [Adineta ricciae]|uniref:HAT C-terminal dimerisation domain-containing protein n=2 Tax=Adineta ricciae TaxID=249248 RepID=A0A815PNQ0_ADIRI|nr:unnamed protein product [Adineta ricciae]